MKRLKKIIFLISLLFFLWGGTVFSQTDSGEVIAPTILYDNNDDIIIMAQKGIVKFHKATGQFEWCTSQNDVIPPVTYLSPMVIDTDGNIWFGSYDYGIGCYDGEDFQYFFNSNIAPDIYGRCESIEIDDNDNIYADFTDDLFIKNGDNWELYDLSAPSDNYEDNCPWFHDIELDSTGTLWIGGRYDYISRPGEYWSLAKFKDGIFTTVSSEYQINSLLFDMDGVLWMGTSGAGLVRYDGSQFLSYNTENSDIHSDSIVHLDLDSNNNIWYSTYHNSWHYNNDDGWNISYHDTIFFFDGNDFTGYYILDHLPDDIGEQVRLSGFIIDENDVVWIGIDGLKKNWNGDIYKSGLLRFDGETWTFFQIPDPPTVNVQEEQQGEYRLRQNFPNPFNPVTSIDYVLAEPSVVRLAVYNIAGQQVALLKEGFEHAGNYSIVWDAVNLPGGLYFCRLESANECSTIKMLLLK